MREWTRADAELGSINILPLCYREADCTDDPAFVQRIKGVGDFAPLSAPQVRPDARSVVLAQLSLRRRALAELEACDEGAAGIGSRRTTAQEAGEAARRRFLATPLPMAGDAEALELIRSDCGYLTFGRWWFRPSNSTLCHVIVGGQHDGYGYEIALDEFRAGSLKRWMQQLAGKPWCTQRALGEFYRAVHAIRTREPDSHIRQLREFHRDVARRTQWLGEEAS